jgi:hypothetical protein
MKKFYRLPNDIEAEAIYVAAYRSKIESVSTSRVGSPNFTKQGNFY